MYVWDDETKVRKPNTFSFEAREYGIRVKVIPKYVGDVAETRTKKIPAKKNSEENPTAA